MPRPSSVPLFYPAVCHICANCTSYTTPSHYPLIDIHHTHTQGSPTLIYPTMKESYRMLVPDSIPAIKPKMGANTDPNQPSFKRLEIRVDQTRGGNEKELEGIREL